MCVYVVDEDIDTFCRRRARQARTVANSVGLWSIVWCQRVIAWSAHLKRAALYQHPCTKLLNLNAATWLMTMRSQWVSVTGTRNSVLAGRTGTRLNIGRPQVRWTDGLSVALEVVKVRQESLKGNNALSISTRIREALSELRISLTDNVD